MKKKWIMLVLTICLAVGAMTPIAFAEDVPAADLTISTKEQLLAFAAAVNDGTDDFAGKTVALADDIDLAGENWVPIGGYDGSKAFKGTFDGQDHAIKNLTITKTDDESATLRLGLFSKIQNATIQNLTITDANITATGADVRAAVLVGTADMDSGNIVVANTFSNITINGTNKIDVDSVAHAYGAGIAAYSYTADLDNIHVSGLTMDLNSSGNSVRAGGIIAYVNNQHGDNSIRGSGGKYAHIKTTLDNFSIRDITIDATAASSDVALIGGGFGYLYRGNLLVNTDDGSSGLITNLKIDADVKGVNAGGLIGYSFKQGDNYTNDANGVAYSIEPMAINNIDATGIDFDLNTVSGNQAIAGGIVGYCQSFAEFEACSVSGTITETTADGTVNGSSEMGGFVGISHDRTQMYTNCSADVDMDTSNKVGGFVGNITVNGSGMTASYYECTASGNVNGDCAGGFAGFVNHHTGKEANVVGCSATGAVYGTGFAGGMIGSTREDCREVTIMNSVASDSVTGAEGAKVAGIIGYAAMKSGQELNLGNVTSSVKPATNLAEGSSVSVYEAKIENEPVKTLAEAVAAANAAEGEVKITLLTDAKVSAAMEVTGKVAIDGNGKTITYADGYAGTMLEVSAGASLTMTDVTIDGGNEWTFRETEGESGTHWFEPYVTFKSTASGKVINASVLVNAGTLTLGEDFEMINVTASDGTDAYQDGVALITSTNGTLNVQSATISGNAGKLFSIVSSSVDIADSTIDGNLGCGRNAGLIEASGGTVDITNTSFNHNKALARGATILGVNSGAVVTFKNSTIDYNKQLNKGDNTAGSMVVLRDASEFIMTEENGGKSSISYNSGFRAGAVASRWSSVNGKITLKAGTIIGNVVADDGGWGAEAAFARSTITIESGMKIDGDIVANNGDANVQITGGDLTGSTVSRAGGVLAVTGGTFKQENIIQYIADCPIASVELPRDENGAIIGTIMVANDGSINFPQGAKVTYKTGNSETPSASVTLPTNTTVGADGTTTVGEGGGKLDVGGVTLDVPAGSTVDSATGKISVSKDGEITVGGVTVAIPEGSTIEPDSGTITKPGGDKVVVNDDGTVTLPEGGEVTIGDVAAELPAGAIIDPESGAVTLPEGGDVVIGGVTVEVSAGAVINPESGEVTLPEGGKVTIDGKEYTLPEGGSVEVNEDGTLTLPGGTTVILPDGSAVTIPEGQTGTVEAGGTAVLPAGSTVTKDEQTTTLGNGGTVSPDGTVTHTPIRVPGTSGGQNPRYSITAEKTENGSVKVSPPNAAVGSTVTVTVDPDTGYKLGNLTVLDKNGKEIELTNKGNGKYTFKMPNGKVTVEVAFVEAVTENPFVDIAEGTYYYDAVLWAVENGITNGKTETAFAPNATCSRAQVVTFLWRAAGCPAPESYENPFADVDEDAYYYSAVLWAVEQGITNGTGDGSTFSPYDTVTRGQVVTFLWRLAGEPKSDRWNSFEDVSFGKYYHDAVVWAAVNGITTGKTTITFAPNTGCTRGNIVTFLYRDLGDK